MIDKNISSLVVTDDSKKPIGIVTERDLLRRICVNDASSSNMQIRDIMSFPLLTIDATASVGEATNFMILNRVRHLLVIEENDINKPLGIKQVLQGFEKVYESFQNIKAFLRN